MDMKRKSQWKELPRGSIDCINKLSQRPARYTICGYGAMHLVISLCTRPISMPADDLPNTIETGRGLVVSSETPHDPMLSSTKWAALWSQSPTS